MGIQVLPTGGSIAGRIGKGLGQGISNQLPKEIERSRLASGLKQFEQNSENLTPLQQYTQLAAIPGMTPAMIQALPEILKQQNIRGAYAKRANKKSSADVKEGQSKNPFKDINFANLPQNQETQPRNQQQPSGNVSPDEMGQPQVVNTNPLRQEAIPRKPWTQDRFNEEIARNFEDMPGITLEQNAALAKQAESRELAQPEAEQQIDAYFKEQQRELQDKFMNQLQLIMHKKDAALLEDVPGEMISNMQRGMEKELRTNPKATVDDVVNKWAKKGLDLSKARNQALALAAEQNWVKPLIGKKDSYRNKLKEYADIFEKTGNSEEYSNLLQTKFEMSPQGSASIAYPRNENVRKYVSKVKPSKVNDIKNYAVNSRKYAADIENIITSNDSILAIARDLREIDPYFDQNEFFQQLSEDKDRIGLNARQRREIAEGESAILPSWGDVLILPFFRGLK